MKIYISILKFFFIGSLFIVSNHHLYLNNAQDVGTFFDLFYDWLGNLFQHGMQITGYVVNSEWLPGNTTTSILPP
ncbi:MAG: hypothetical protein ABIG28_01530 [archaeon]